MDIGSQLLWANPTERACGIVPKTLSLSCRAAGCPVLSGQPCAPAGVYPDPSTVRTAAASRRSVPPCRESGTLRTVSGTLNLSVLSVRSCNAREQTSCQRWGDRTGLIYKNVSCFLITIKNVGANEQQRDDPRNSCCHGDRRTRAKRRWLLRNGGRSCRRNPSSR